MDTVSVPAAAARRADDYRGCGPVRLGGLRSRSIRLAVGLAVLVASLHCASGGTETRVASPYVRWTHGPPHEGTFFPIAVWLQNPRNAPRYRAAGFNLYVGLWKGPTEDQLAALRRAGMKVICAQNEVGLHHREDPIIIGWMHGDEPDNAQPRPNGKGYGPPVPPEKIEANYRRIKQADPSRPVLLNLGQGVAWDRWHGRGVRTNHPEDYPLYLRGCDIASFDIYPVVHKSPEVAGKLWYVARGVERLRKWARPEQIVWNCIECTHIQSADRKASPKQVRAEVWMSLIHGSMGLIYFVHEWKPRFREAALLEDAAMLRAVSAINHRIQALAPVLNSPTVKPGVRVMSTNPDVPVATMTKRLGDEWYVFAVAMREGVTEAVFEGPSLESNTAVEVLDEGRTLRIGPEGKFRDKFADWDVHLYRWRATR